MVPGMKKTQKKPLRLEHQTLRTLTDLPADALGGVAGGWAFSQITACPSCGAFCYLGS